MLPLPPPPATETVLNTRFLDLTVDARAKSTLSKIGLPSSSTQPDSSKFSPTSLMVAHPSCHTSFLPLSPLLPLSSFTLLMFPHRNTICSGVSSSSPHLGHCASSSHPIFSFHHLPMPFPSRSRQSPPHRLPYTSSFLHIFFLPPLRPLPYTPPQKSINRRHPGAPSPRLVLHTRLRPHSQ